MTQIDGRPQNPSQKSELTGELNHGSVDSWTAMTGIVNLQKTHAVKILLHSG